MTTPHEKILREALEHIVEYWNRSENHDAMCDALWHIIETAEQVLAAATVKESLTHEPAPNQMREALLDCVKTMQLWRMCELGLIAGPTEDEIESVITKAEQALAEPAPDQMRELEAKVRSQTNLIKSMEQTQSHLLSQQAKWVEATRTLESEREANRILTEELEQAKQSLSATVKESLTHEPAPLVRLTEEEIDKCYGPATRAFKRFKYSVRGQMSMPQDSFEWHFAHAIMDAMIAKNGGKV